MITRNEAIAQGQKWYNGSACKHCGSTKKYVKGYSCMPCNLKRNLHKLYDRKIIGKYKTPEKEKARLNRWRKNNPIEYIKQWCIDNNKDIMPKDADVKKIQEIYIKCHHKTQDTGIVHEVDHIVPIAKGGVHHHKNLQILTREENRKKGNKL